MFAVHFRTLLWLDDVFKGSTSAYRRRAGGQACVFILSHMMWGSTLPAQSALGPCLYYAAK